MSFGADSNAHTAKHETVYKLSMPDTEPETIDKALRIFSDFAYGLLLPQEEIDKERDVILEEARTFERDLKEIFDIADQFGEYGRVFTASYLGHAPTEIAEGDGYTREIDYFRGCIAAGSPPDAITPEGALDAVRVVSAEMRSASSD